MGRPNVGKSALFNRLAGRNLAVVYDQPGVTRDRLYTRAFWGDKEFVLIDTGERAVGRNCICALVHTWPASCMVCCFTGCPETLTWAPKYTGSNSTQ